MLLMLRLGLLALRWRRLVVVLRCVILPGRLAQLLWVDLGLCLEEDFVNVVFLGRLQGNLGYWLRVVIRILDCGVHISDRIDQIEELFLRFLRWSLSGLAGGS